MRIKEFMLRSKEEQVTHDDVRQQRPMIKKGTQKMGIFLLDDQDQVFLIFYHAMNSCRKKRQEMR
jgi:hypothetical protein